MKLKILFVLSILFFCAFAFDAQAAKEKGNQLTTPQPVTVSVHHNHGAGGCNGFLTVDAKGITFKGGASGHDVTIQYSALVKHEFLDNTDWILTKSYPRDGKYSRSPVPWLDIIYRTPDGTFKTIKFAFTGNDGMSHFRTVEKELKAFNSKKEIK